MQYYDTEPQMVLFGYPFSVCSNFVFGDKASQFFCLGRSENPPEGRNEGTAGIEGMNRNKIYLNLKARINYTCKIFNHSLIQSFIPFLE